MDRYEGDHGISDKIVGGGSFVSKNGTGHEVCNFVKCPDGFVYGHVETIKGERDRNIHIESIGGSGECVDGVDVVWTATNPESGGRRVVGWYRNATVFRIRQRFEKPPTPQHRKDRVDTYRIRARVEDVHCLYREDRQLKMGRGAGWMGQTPWKVLSKDASPEICDFLEQVQWLLDEKTYLGTNASPTDEEYLEGTPKLRQHLQRERASGLSARKKDVFREEHGKLFCEKCKLDPVKEYGADFGPAVIEVHHAATMVGNMSENHHTKLADLQCLCANCHRLTHAELRWR